MCPKELGKSEMEIAQARDEHQSLISKLMHGPGDAMGAMYRAERMFGLPYWSQWNLRHKRRATVQFMQRVRYAYLDMLAQSVRREIEILKAAEAKGSADVSDRVLLDEAEKLVAKIETRKTLTKAT